MFSVAMLILGGAVALGKLVQVLQVFKFRLNKRLRRMKSAKFYFPNSRVFTTDNVTYHGSEGHPS